MSSSDVAALAARLDALERSNRSLRRLLAVAVAAPLVLLVAHPWQSAHALPPQKTVEAENFIVKDGEGKQRAKLGMSQSGQPIISLYGENGNGRLLLTLGEGDAPAMVYRNADNKLGLVINSDGKLSAVSFFDEKENPRLQLASGEAQGSFLAFWDAAKHQRMQLIYIAEKETPALFLNTKGGKPHGALMLDAEGGANFLLANAKGEPIFSKPD